MRLLIAEDDNDLCTSLQRSLRQYGYAVDCCDNSQDAVYMGSEEPYDLAILDLGLPECSGLDVLSQWRHKERDLLVLILTARDTWHDKVAGFQAGADDYLSKPFHFQELLARIEALLRRRHGQVNPNIHFDGLQLDDAYRQIVLSNGTELPLTATEFKLLRYFMSYPDQVLSKTRLSEHIYEYDNERDSNVIEVYIRRLRDKIGTHRIQTRRGQGYIFNSHENEPL